MKGGCRCTSCRSIRHHLLTIEVTLRHDLVLWYATTKVKGDSTKDEREHYNAYLIALGMVETLLEMDHAESPVEKAERARGMISHAMELYEEATQEAKGESDPDAV
jgi:hypothetical protein